MSGKKKTTSSVFFLGGPCHFSWQEMSEFPNFLKCAVAVRPVEYHIEKLVLGPQPGENAKPLFALVSRDLI